MKKNVIAAVFAAALIVSVSSCGGSAPASTTAAKTAEAPAETTAAKEFTAKEVTDAVLAEIPINSSFEKSRDSLSDYFSGLDTDALSDFSYVMCASGAYPDEIAVFVFNDESAAGSAKSAVEDRLSEQKETYETYTPDEFYKLENAVTAVSGKYVYYLVTSDNDKAESIVKGYIK